jgi:hypothetical protein
MPAQHGATHAFAPHEMTPAVPYVAAHFPTGGARALAQMGHATHSQLVAASLLPKPCTEQLRERIISRPSTLATSIEPLSAQNPTSF